VSARRSSPHRPGKRLIAHDQATGFRFVAGADEAGRGCLAGPLVAAAVVFDIDRLIGPDAALLSRLDDSKRLSGEVRELLFTRVTSLAASWAVRVMPAARIDVHGIQSANLCALHGALLGLKGPVEIAFCDGFDLAANTRYLAGMPSLDYPVHQLIKGDQTSAAVAAAAILAKVTRDRLMADLDLHTGGTWAYSEHHGYATSAHHERIRQHGISEHHRTSFASTAYQGMHHVRAVGSPSERIAQVLDSDTCSVTSDPHQRNIEPVATHASL
jgi:ribonuclease HII